MVGDGGVVGTGAAAAADDARYAAERRAAADAYYEQARRQYARAQQDAIAVMTRAEGEALALVQRAEREAAEIIRRAEEHVVARRRAGRGVPAARATGPGQRDLLDRLVGSAVRRALLRTFHPGPVRAGRYT